MLHRLAATAFFGALTSSPEDVYSDGSLVFYGGGFYWGLDYDNFSLLLSNSWTVQQRDAAFTANFSGDVVPEPATGLLSGVVLAVLFLVRRRAA